MKKHHIVLGMAVLLICVGFSGCFEELEALDKPDYITVTVHCDVVVDVVTGTVGDPGDPRTIAARDVLVRVEIIKAGGERVSNLATSDINGHCQRVTGTFKLYREQPITCIANVILTSVEKQYPDYTFNSRSKTILWDEIYPMSDFGDSTSREVELWIIGVS